MLIHASESAVKQHPAYNAAKVGDDDAAIALVLDTFNMERARQMRRFEGGAKPTLVSAHALEREGVNAIPEVFAESLGQVLGWPLDNGVVRVNVVSHTGADGFWRLARLAEFDGLVHPGRTYCWSMTLSAWAVRLPICVAISNRTAASCWLLFA